jgi:tetrahydromethanopterin S-methyltransferase subunit C
VVVCPTGQSEPFTPSQMGLQAQEGTVIKDNDVVIADTAKPGDLMVVGLVGLIAAAVAAAAAIRNIKGSSERYGLPLALAALKLPTGAVTAVLGLLLMRGQFVPGLTALDTTAQILAWALVFGFAQELFTHFVDQQGQTVLSSVRAADTVQHAHSPT